MSSREVFEREVDAARAHYLKTRYVGQLAGLHDRPAQREAMLRMVEDGEGWLSLAPGKVRTFDFHAWPGTGDAHPYTSLRNKALAR